MQAEEVEFLELLGGRVQYHVPKWQRRYCWGEADVTRLVEDLVAIAAANSDRAHYGGALITFCPPAQPAGVTTTERVVDGQQRLTTVSLLLASIADQMGDDDHYGEWTRDDIRDLLRNPREKTSGKRRKLRLQTDGDEEEYARILEGEPQGKGAVTNAWRLIRELVDRHGADTLMAGLGRFRVVSLAVGADDDPQQIFESLNATGKALTESEKVKNWLLMGFPDAQQQELYEKHWLKMEEELAARHDSRRIDLFLRDLMRWRTGKITAIHQTYEVFRRWAIETEWDDKKRRPELFRRLAHLAHLYGILTGTAGPHPEEAIASSLQHIRAMGLHTHRPFTLRLLNELSPAHGDPISTVDQTADMFRTISTWITRLWLTGRTAGLNTAFARLAAGGLVDREAYLADWINRIRALHRQNVGVPSDEDVVRGVRTRQMYFGKQARLAVLYRLMEDEEGDDAPSRHVFWSERVMPYRLSDTWREMLGREAEELHIEWRYRLANLVLVGAGNDAPGEHASFDAKKVWYRRSPIGMTWRVAEEPAWDEATLMRRSQELAERAIRVWPWEDRPPEATDGRPEAVT